MKTKNDSRREFLKKGILAAAAGSIIPLAAPAKENRKTVKMLTPDGKLVEVDETVVARASKQKASNKDILDWRNQKG